MPAKIQINCPDETSYRLIQKFLNLNNTIVSYHTLPLSQEKSLKVVIKGLPFHITNDGLAEELNNLGFEPNFRPFHKNKKIILFIYI